MVITSNSYTFVGIDAEFMEVAGTSNVAPADLRKPGSDLDLPIAARSIDRLTKVVRTIADRLDPDDRDADRLREATGHRDEVPTADPVSHSR